MSEEQPIIRYLNTDLDLICAADLTPLTSALDARGVFPLSVDQGGDGLWYSILEIRNEAEPREPETTICVMLDAIEAIDREAKEIWLNCIKRENSTSVTIAATNRGRSTMD